MAQAWMIEQLDGNADGHIIYRLDADHGVFLDRQLAEAKIAELNEAERIRTEEVAERGYQDRLSIWRRQRDDHIILVAAGAWQGPFALGEPKRYTLTRTIDEYRLSDPLELHGREEG